MKSPPGASLPAPGGGDPRDLALAAAHAPIVLLDAAEPFLPLVAGFTVFREPGRSSSFPRDISLRPDPTPSPSAGFTRRPAAPAGHIEADAVVEYAIWWDWDIGHLYDLEHVWSYVDDHGRLVAVEASQHGAVARMRWRGRTPREGQRPLVCAQPGKHALAPSPRAFTASASARAACRRAAARDAGADGLLVTPLFAGQLHADAEGDRRARDYLRGQAFEPTFRFELRFELSLSLLRPWPAVAAWIPGRLAHVLAALP